jgi:hypothetical protein
MSESIAYLAVVVKAKMENRPIEDFDALHSLIR